jgi:pimeloyl-ACP methyl ester carboxylesterase
MTTAPTPTVVLVHGAWHSHRCWNHLVAALEGLTCVCLDLPSSGTDPATLGGMYDDAQVVRDALLAVDGPSVVVAHSYGGVPVTEAVTPDLGVQHILYVGAFVLDVGESAASAAAGAGPPPWWDLHETSIGVVDPAGVFYGDVPADRLAEAVADVQLQSLRSCGEPLTRAAWRSTPSSYLVCDQDRAVPPQAQEAMARRTGQAIHLDSGHSPFLSQPDVLAAAIRSTIAQI